MSDLPWLTILGVVPLVGAALIAGLPTRLARPVALATSLVVLLGTIVMCAAFDADGARFQFVQAYDWIPAFGVQYAVGVDGIALVLVALVAVLVPDAEWTAEWCAANGVANTPALAEDAKFRAALAAAVDRTNTDLSVIERVRRFVLADAPFAIENEQLTPSLKIRRHVLKQVYGERLEGLYRG